ncbi:MSS51 [Candida pseudojiufengensis]|uniref:MSS51 n=1 Tax=Candida pseudojiufengensis TaxID=497109 RepID=UPI002224FBC9|nr:MSS51 [Candida pseudojiufengensis]KAI5961920.1 MSS51 [Candida pseudojiufengensis]
MLNMNQPNSGKNERKLYNWDESPYEDIRMHAAIIRAKASCPVTKGPVEYVCPLSGIPTHSSKEAWENDKEYHELKKYENLKKVNLYEHDLRSRKKFEEFAFPGEQERDFMINISDWDSFFYTRDFPPMNDEFNLAAATKVLTYPMTIASIIHKFSPYQIEPKGPLTIEGAKSLGALRYSLYPPYQKMVEGVTHYKERPMRIFIVGARMESMLPGYVWKQFGYLFPRTRFEIHLIGPESYFDKESRSFAPTNVPNGRPLIERFDDQITIHHHSQFFNELYDTGDLFPFDPYLDMFFLFHPGFKTADEMHWDKSLKGFLESKCPIFITGFHNEDIDKEISWLKNHPLYDELDILMNKTDNKFACTKLDIIDANPTETFSLNSKVFGIRGKRYEAIKQ